MSIEMYVYQDKKCYVYLYKKDIIFNVKEIYTNNITLIKLWLENIF